LLITYVLLVLAQLMFVLQDVQIMDSSVVLTHVLNVIKML